MINFICGDHEIINTTLNLIVATLFLIGIILFFSMMLPYVRDWFVLLECPPSPTGWGCAVPCSPNTSAGWMRIKSGGNDAVQNDEA